MKKNISFLFAFTLSFALCILVSCDAIDSINNLPLNFTVNVQLTLSGTNTAVSQSGIADLSTSQTYQENLDKIKSKSFKEAAFRTISVSPTDLSGTVTMIFEFGGNTITKNLGTVKPSDYMTKPLVLSFTSDEMSKIDTYLNSTKSPVFKATINATGMPAGQKSMVISVDLVFEAVAKF